MSEQSDKVKVVENPSDLNEIIVSVTGAGLIEIARDPDSLVFAGAVIRAKLWDTIRQYVSDTYGDVCHFLNWKFKMVSGTIAVDDIIAMDSKRNIIPTTEEIARLSYNFWYARDASLAQRSLLYAFDISGWHKDFMHINSVSGEDILVSVHNDDEPLIDPVKPGPWETEESAS